MAWDTFMLQLLGMNGFPAVAGVGSAYHKGGINKTINQDIYRK
jgi:hypothetical protein